MTDDDRFDGLLRLGLEDIRGIEPSNVDIQAVIRRATPSRPARRVPRRFAFAAALVLALSGGTALAIPQTRDAILDAFGAFKTFFTGGQPPGDPILEGETKGSLNWFTGADRATGSVLAEAGSVRLIAYRNEATGDACLGYGLAADECRPDQDWAGELERTSVVLRGPLYEPDTQGRVPLVGIIADDVTTVEIRHADGSVERAQSLKHGFVLFADPGRRPTKLVAYAATGSVIETVDVSGRGWNASP